MPEIDLSMLPRLNAVLNATAAVLLAAGWVSIRRGRRRLLHGSLMSAAFIVSMLFLVSYLYYHAHHMRTDYPRTGFIRGVYLTILASHIVLAATVPPMAVVALYHAVRRRFDRHRRLTRVLAPIWLYVSITGVIIYLMLAPYYP